VTVDLARAYGAQAGDPDLSEHWSGPPGMVDRLANRLSVSPSDAVLDVGCGVGGPAHRLRMLRGCSVVGVDVVLPVVAEARRRGARAGRPLPVAVASAVALPFEGASFDQVWALGVLAHLEDAAGFAGEAARVLRPGGVVAVTEALWDGRRSPRFASTAPRPWTPVASRAVREALEGAGLSVEEDTWPGAGIPGALEASDPALRADLADGRLVPGLLLGWRRRR
jgi:SAM-dependent methyltransferase